MSGSEEAIDRIAIEEVIVTDTVNAELVHVEAHPLFAGLNDAQQVMVRQWMWIAGAAVLQRITSLNQPIPEPRSPLDLSGDFLARLVGEGLVDDSVGTSSGRTQTLGQGE